MSSTCPAGIPPVEFVKCDPCIERTFTYEDFIIKTPPQGGPSFGCKVTRKYLWRVCEVGLGVGRHLHSVTLLPGEAIELEVVRKHKYSQSLAAEASVESEVETEVQIRTLEEWSKSETLNGKIKHSGGFKIFGIGFGGSQEYQVGLETKESRLKEVVGSAARTVSERFEIAMSVKSETENRFRALRKVKNPNPCQPVTYHHFQLMKKYKRELFLIEQTYDCSPPAGDVGQPPSVTFTDDLRAPARVPRAVVPTPPDWLVSDDRKGSIRREGDDDRKSVRQEDIAVTLDRSTSRELTRDQALAELKARGAKDEAKVIQDLDKLADPGGGGLIFSEEYCVGTDSVFVQAQVSDCAACEDTSLQKKELEVKKLELELKKLECEVELCREGYPIPEKAVDPV